MRQFQLLCFVTSIVLLSNCDAYEFLRTKEGNTLKQSSTSINWWTNIEDEVYVSEIEKAFKTWPYFTFTRVDIGTPESISVKFYAFGDSAAGAGYGKEVSPGVAKGGSIYLRNNLDAYLIYPVMIHEIGHVLGLAHVSREYPDLPTMTSYAFPDITSTLHQDDIDGLSVLYGLPRIQLEAPVVLFSRKKKQWVLTVSNANLYVLWENKQIGWRFTGNPISVKKKYKFDVTFNGVTKTISSKDYVRPRKSLVK